MNRWEVQHSCDTGAVWILPNEAITKMAWVGFEHWLRETSDAVADHKSVKQAERTSDNVVVTSQFAVSVPIMVNQTNTAQSGAVMPLAQIKSRFASKHRSKATEKAFTRMHKSVEDAVRGLADSLGGNLAGVVLSGPLVESQVGDGSVDLLVILHELPESVYELSKRLSAEVLYPVFKTYKVFPGIWCVSLDQWKESLRSSCASPYSPKERGIPVLGEKILGQANCQNAL